MSKYIGAIDSGTTSTRFILFDERGGIVAYDQREHRQIFPQSGWVEHDPLEIWERTQQVIRTTLAKAGVQPQDLAAIGITNQRETTLIWDKQTGAPIYNAIVWQDRRTKDLCEKLKKEGFEPLFKKKTGLLLDPYFSATKIRWILDHVDGARAKAEKGELAFGTVDSWLVWQMTEGREHITDATNASRTLLYNIHEGKWDEELLKILDIPREILPKVKGSSEIYGDCSENVCSTLIPIGGIAGDQQAALFGQTCFEQGMGKVTYGTGCFILMNTGTTPPKPSKHLLNTIAYELNGKTYYALEGSVFIGGAVVQWLRDSLGIIKNYEEVEDLAGSVPSSEGVVFVPAFTGLGAPHWDPNARGLIAGITRGTTSAHISRAALKGICLQVNDILEIIQESLPINEIRVDGGAVKDDLLMQVQVNLANLPIIRPKWSELTAIGAAFLAGLSVGYWKDQEELKKLWQEDKRFEPKFNEDKRKREIGLWRHAIKCAKMLGEYHD